MNVDKQEAALRSVLSSKQDQKKQQDSIKTVATLLPNS
jgi:hypothetical protein